MVLVSLFVRWDGATEAAMQVLMVTSGESNLFYFTVIISILFYLSEKTQDMVVIIYLFCAKAFF